MKKFLINLFLTLPFILSIFFFTLRSTIHDIVNIDDSIIEQGFGYSAIATILFVVGILLVCIRIVVYLYKNYKFARIKS